jgi:hypothetical protein
MRRGLLMAGLAGLSLAVAISAAADPVEWEVNGHFYEVVSDEVTWPIARNQALSMSWQGHPGRLASVTSAEEQAFLESTFGDLLNMAFLGGFQTPGDIAPDYAWHWLSGEPWDYTHWASGEPNDFGGPETKIEIQQIGTTYMWNDWGSDDGPRPRYVVEYEPLPSFEIAGPVINPTNGNSYYLLAESSWQAAQEYALTLGGNLVTINDEPEQEWVFTTFGTYGGRYRSIWIGLTDELNEGEFVWVSGEPVTYDNWMATQPDDPTGNDDYVHMCRISEGFPGVTARWNDISSPITWYCNFDPLCGVVEVPADPSNAEVVSWGEIKAMMR